MEEFRNGVLETKGIEFIVLADADKLRIMSGSGKKLVNKIDFDSHRTWLFVDDNETEENKEFFQQFKKLLGDRFVRVPIDGNAGSKGQRIQHSQASLY